MRAIAGDHEHGIAVAEVHRMQRPRIGPSAHLAVHVAVAEDARCTGRPGGGKHHPAALGPDCVIDSGVGAVRRMLGSVHGHFGFLHHRPFGDQIGGAFDIIGNEAKSFKPAAIGAAVLVQEWHDSADLGVLNGSYLVP